jgi:NADH-quinone oxidoreductase subunit L
VPAEHLGELSPGALMGLSILAALLGIGIASWWYLKSTEIPDQLAERFADLYRILTHKYYVDEFYNWLIVGPLHIVSEKFLWRVVDAGAIDNVLVNGTGESTAGVGEVLRRIQSGNISSYATWVLVGAVLWLLYVFANQT